MHQACSDDLYSHRLDAKGKWQMWYLTDEHFFASFWRSRLKCLGSLITRIGENAHFSLEFRGNYSLQNKLYQLRAPLNVNCFVRQEVRSQYYLVGAGM